MASTEFQLSTYMRARLETWESDVNTANNTSVVNARIKVWRTNSWTGQTYSSSVRRVITIDGTTVCDWTGEISHYLSYGEIEVASGSRIITHNGDGSKTVTVSASLTDNVSVYLSGASSLSIGLTTIARASQPSINTWPDNSPNFNVGDIITIHMNRKSTSFTHTVKINYGSSSYTIATGVTDNCDFNTAYIASSLYAQMSSATSYSSTISVTTYNGSTEIGTKTCPYTAKAVESNARPSFSDFAYCDTNSTSINITGNNQSLIQGISDLRVIISSTNKATAKYSSTIKTYNASISGLSASANYSTSNLNIDFSSNNFTAGTQVLAVRATDSRGYSVSVSKNVSVLAYAAPVINATATRLNDFENQTTLVVKGTYSPLTIGGVTKNTVSSAQYRYKKQSTSTWGSWTNMSGLSATSAGVYTTTDKVLDLDNNSAYDFEIKVVDKLKTTTVTLVVSVGVPIFRIGTDGNVYNNEKRLVPYDEVAKYSTHVGQIIMTTALTTASQVAAIYGGTWQAWGSGRVPVGVNASDYDFYTVNRTGGSKSFELYRTGQNYGGLTGGSTGGEYRGRVYVSVSGDVNYEASAQPRTFSVVQPYITVYMWKRTA